MRLLADQNAIVYSMPGESSFRICHQDDFGVTAMPAEDAEVFIIRPFSDALGAVYIRVDKDHEITLDQFDIGFENYITLSNQMDREVYCDMVGKAIGYSAEIDGKVVLSRIADLEVREVDLRRSLEGLRTTFPGAFVYLLVSEHFGLWMGASPESLISREGAEFRTMALAGTKWGDEAFGQKEIEEHVVVTKDILQQLEDVDVEVGDMREVTYGALRHLRTDMRWLDQRSVSFFAERLHPTSAVCGYPRNASERFITTTELHNRSLYSGYLGKIRPNGMSDLFVNLRCVQLFRGRIWVYVGGGINSRSEALLEWEETERKKQVVLDAMVYE